MDVHIQDVQEQVIVVTVFSIIGSTRNSQDVYSLQKLRERLIDH